MAGPKWQATPIPGFPSAPSDPAIRRPTAVPSFRTMTAPLSPGSVKSGPPFGNHHESSSRIGPPRSCLILISIVTLTSETSPVVSPDVRPTFCHAISQTGFRRLVGAARNL